MHDVDFADVLGKKPVMLIFATPQLCQSRVCGPVVDLAEQVKAKSSNSDVAFIHMEVYNDNRIDKGIRPQMAAFHLQTEPWLFTFNKQGQGGGADRGRVLGARARTRRSRRRRPASAGRPCAWAP